MATTLDNSRLETDPMVPRPMRISRRWDDTHDTFSIELDPGPRGFPFEAGQFNMLYAFGVGEVAISISGDPAKPETLTHTIRGVGAVTQALRALRPGETIGVRGPYGVGWPMREGETKDVILVAGGIGLAPLRPALYHLLNHRDRYQGVVLTSGFRSPSDILYEDEIREWRSRFDLEIELTVDNADPRWRGAVGVVTKLIPRMPFDPYKAVAMVCGPEIMMRFTVAALEKRGVERSAIFVSMERNMKCAIGFCGHCQLGPSFICKDGPVFAYDSIGHLLTIEEV